MDIRQMRYFLNVAEQGSFHAASGILSIAQSALSRQIQQLEEDLGANLFLRSTKGVRLSPAGEVLLDEVRQILAKTEAARTKTWRAARGQFGRVVIAYTTRVGEMNYAVDAFADARLEMPDIDFQLRFVTPESQPSLLAAGEIDVGLLYDRPIDNRTIRSRDLRTDKVKLLVPSDHPLTRLDKVTLADLRDSDFAFTSPTIAPHMYNQVMAECVRGGLLPRISIVAPHESIFVRLVGARLAIGFCDSSIGERRSIDGLRLIDVEGFGLSLTTVVIWQHDRETPAISNFIDLLARRIEGLPAPGAS